MKETKIVLSFEELELLKKLGIKLPKDTEERKAKEILAKEVKLDGFSGTMTLNCKCCGSCETFFINYVKRVDMPGYAINRVAEPSHEVTRRHLSTVTSCSMCEGENLLKHGTDEMVRMIKNLKAYILSNAKC